MRLCTLLLCLLALLPLHSFAQKAANSPIIHIGYHRTIETIMILRALSPDDYFLKRVKDTAKGRPMIYYARKHFAKYKNHPAVAATQEILNTTADIGGVLFQGVLYANELPGTAMRQEPEEQFWKDHKAELEAYMQVLNSFYADADVASFFKEYKWFYDGAVAESGGYINNNLVVILENYFGKHKEAYYLYLLPLCPYGWGFSLTTAGRQSSVQHSIVAPVHNVAWNVDENRPHDFGFGGKDAKEHYRDIVAHEMTHAFITDVIINDPYKKQINSYDSLFTPMLDSVMQELSYGTWWDFVNEYFVRLAHIRTLNIINIEDAAALRNIDVYENKFVLIPEGEELIKEYENNRRKYATINSFLPVLIQQFARYTRKDIDEKIMATSGKQ